MVGLMKEYRTELDGIRRDQERLNAAICEPGGGFDGFVGGLTGQPPFGAIDTQAQPWTLALGNSYFPITLNRVLLSNSYETQGLLRTLVDVVVDDAFGDGVNFTSAQLSPEELLDLNRCFGTNQKRQQYLNTFGTKINFNAGYEMANSDEEACRQVGKWGRLFGGSGLIVNTTQRFDREFRIEQVREDEPLTFIAADRWELVLNQINANSEANLVPYNYYGNPLHRSRVTRFVWAQAPSWIRLRLQGWGMSVLEECIRPVSTYLKFERLAFELIDEAKVDVFRVKGFNALALTRAGTQKVVQRIQLSNQVKSFQNALIMDQQDEYQQKTLTSIFPGLAEFKDSLRFDLCAYMKFPYNKLFGVSASGFGSGKDVMDNYHATVRNFRKQAKPNIMEAGQVRCQQMYGSFPDDLDQEWPPLAILDGVEQEAVYTSTQNRITQKFTLGLTTGKECMGELRKAELHDGDKTEVELGLRDAAPPPSENPDEAEAGREHEETMAKAKAKPAPAGGKKK